jgi:DNA repair exonuclease SbcCD ATPase subunit
MTEKLQKELNKLIERIKELEKERDRYKRGFYILHDYFDSIPDDEKQWVDAKLMNINL